MKLFYFNKKDNKGFTLIEVLLVIALIAVLAGITIIAINPARQTGQALNAQRKADVNTILNAIHQYALENSGQLPSSIPSGTNCEGEEYYRICKTDAVSCTSLVDLSVLTASEVYLTSIPLNPGNSGTNHTGYNAIQSTNGRVTVCAPNPYGDDTIEATR